MKLVDQIGVGAILERLRRNSRLGALQSLSGAVMSAVQTVKLQQARVEDAVAAIVGGS